MLHTSILHFGWQEPSICIFQRICLRFPKTLGCDTVQTLFRQEYWMAIIRAKDVLREFSSELSAFEILHNHGGSNELKPLTEDSARDTQLLSRNFGQQKCIQFHHCPAEGTVCVTPRTWGPHRSPEVQLICKRKVSLFKLELGTLWSLHCSGRVWKLPSLTFIQIMQGEGFPTRHLHD